MLETFETKELEINMGPQHPSTHGVLRLILNLEGTYGIYLLTEEIYPEWFFKDRFSFLSFIKDIEGTSILLIQNEFLFWCIVRYPVKNRILIDLHE